ncbi:OmpA family protein [Sphingomonas sp. LT1P40]|uniref:OmpA family protein n=1 Tax=Alteristakelama amylovorans TaxID=3096166 RepID=UPI002FCADFB6
MSLWMSAAAICIMQTTPGAVRADDPGLVIGAPGADVASPAALDEDTPEIAALRDNDRGVLLLSNGGADAFQAGDLLTQAVAAKRPGAGDAVSRYNLSQFLTNESKFAEAELMQRAALADLSGRWRADDPRLATIKLGLARSLAALGQAPEAELLAREAIAALAARGCTESTTMADGLTLLAGFERDRGKLDSAEAGYRAAIAIGERLLPAATPAEDEAPSPRAAAQARRFAALARLLLTQDRKVEALALATRSVALGPYEIEAQFALGLVRLGMGTRDAATLRSIAQGLDAGAFAGGEVRTDVIDGRARLARWLAADNPYQGWVQIRQAQRGLGERMVAEAVTAEDARRLSMQFAGTQRATIYAAWQAARAAAPIWDRDFTIYFDIDRSEINPSAAMVLDAAAATWRRVGGEILVEGHLDRRGTPNYDVGLSDRMASAAKRYLEERGVPAMAISTIAFGQSRPAVATARGVPERANRRAVIRIGPAS